MPTTYCAHGSGKQHLHLLGLQGSTLRLDDARWRNRCADVERHEPPPYCLLERLGECRVNLDHRRLLEPLPARRARGAYSLQVGWRIAAGP